VPLCGHFINRSDTWYFANNNSRHFSFNAGERFLPLYQFAGEDNKKITSSSSNLERSTISKKLSVGAHFLQPKK
jgi:hypothetical protein